MRYHQALKATRPGPEETPILPREVESCPKCRRKSNVRVLPNKKFFCVNCSLEFWGRSRMTKPLKGRPRKLIIKIKLDMVKVDRAVELWQAGLHLGEIAERVCVDPDDLAIAFITLAREDKIGQWGGGALGNPGAN
jgi:ribosomal protein L37AE/L43A